MKLLKQNNYFLLYSNCFLTNGYNQSIISDLQRGFYVIITNEHFNILEELQKNPINDVLQKNPKHKKEIVELIDYLIRIDVAHYCSSKEEFPDISREFSSPYEIIDCIIELSDFNYKHSKLIFESLSKLGCQTLEFRGYNLFSLVKIQKMINEIPLTRIRSVEIYLGYSSKIKLSSYEHFVNRNPIVSKLIVHSVDEMNINNASERLIFTKQRINSNLCCGNIQADFFTPNLQAYLHSPKANSCLSNKISIDEEGNIKNCPSMMESFGNITKIRLEEVLKIKEFQKYWTIKKDDIDICKVCEYRYICTDCRAFLEDPMKVESKPLKCGYNPYTNIWEDWDKNPLKYPAIKHYGLNKF